MKNNHRPINYYTQGQQFAARVVLSVGILFGYGLGSTQAAPGGQASSSYELLGGEANEQLRAHYHNPYSCYVKSVFENRPDKHVEGLQCQLIVKKIQGYSSIEIEDLFKSRSTHPGEPAKVPQRVLVTGNPGTGKTALSKKLAYQWAVGAWGQEFDAVYLVPIRELQQDKYDNAHYTKLPTLATAIVNICFTRPSNEVEYKRLRDHIKEELQKPTTLVILDGLDERVGADEKILCQAKAGAHKLLMLSRPYGIEIERCTVKIQVEHVGLNAEQRERYVRQEVLDEKLAEALLDYIHKHENIGSIAHIPVNLEILCALWKDDGCGVREALENGSLSSFYEKLAYQIWERYVTARALPDRNELPVELFDTLGQIGLATLQQGKALISLTLVDKYAKTRRVQNKLEDAGFLLLQEDASEQQAFYKFPNLTFQEYFAGRWLAIQFLGNAAKAQKKLKQLWQDPEYEILHHVFQECLKDVQHLLEDQNAKNQCKEFVEDHKYDSNYGQTLAFLSGELHRQLKKKSSEYRGEQLSKLLELLDSAPKEIIGLQHVLLQADMLYEWLCLADSEEEHSAFVNAGSQVLDNLEKWALKEIKIPDCPQGEQTVVQLMNAYWKSQDPKLIPYIVGKLYKTPLVIRPCLGRFNRPYNKKAVLYLEEGGEQAWRGTNELIDTFSHLIEGELDKNSQTTIPVYSKEDARAAVSFYERASKILKQVYKDQVNHRKIAEVSKNLQQARHFLEAI